MSKGNKFGLKPEEPVKPPEGVPVTKENVVEVAPVLWHTQTVETPHDICRIFNTLESKGFNITHYNRKFMASQGVWELIYRIEKKVV